MNLIILTMLILNFIPICQNPTNLDWITITQKPYKNAIIPDIASHHLLTQAFLLKSN